MAEAKKLAELAKKAKEIKTNPELKHFFTEKQKDEARENATLMLPHQFATMKEDPYERI